MSHCTKFWGVAGENQAERMLLCWLATVGINQNEHIQMYSCLLCICHFGHYHIFSHLACHPTNPIASPWLIKSGQQRKIDAEPRVLSRVQGSQRSD